MVNLSQSHGWYIWMVWDNVFFPACVERNLSKPTIQTHLQKKLCCSLASDTSTRSVTTTELRQDISQAAVTSASPQTKRIRIKKPPWNTNKRCFKNTIPSKKQNKGVTHSIKSLSSYKLTYPHRHFLWIRSLEGRCSWCRAKKSSPKWISGIIGFLYENEEVETRTK